MPSITAAVVLCFFQAEDGIRDSSVTGVQPCALPISAILARDLDGIRGRGILAEGIDRDEIGRASCRERVEISGVAVSLKKKKGKKLSRQNRRIDRKHMSSRFSPVVCP